MRFSRRASIAAKKTPSPRLPPPFCAHCSISLSQYPAHIRCADVSCPRLTLCVFCYSVGAYDIEPHRIDHSYRVVESVPVPIYAPDWTADEEERLLHAVAEHGPGHWRDVADYVRTKGPMKCEMHYKDVFLQSPTAPFADLSAFEAEDNLDDAPSPSPFGATHFRGMRRSRKGKGKGKGKGKSKGKNAEPDVEVIDDDDEDDDDERSVPNISPPKKNGALEGYNDLRGDFDVEWDDNAEDLIASLEIDTSDEEDEVDLKLRLIEIYDERLRRREAIKAFLFDRSMLNLSSLQNPDRRGARDEKELSARLQIFSRLLPSDEFHAFHESIMAEYRTAKELKRVTESRATGGMRSILELDSYDVERKNRAIALAKAKTHPFTPASSPIPSSKRNGSPGRGPDLENVPECSRQGSVDAENSSPPIATPDEVVEVAESKCTVQRKAREQRRINQSPYPLMEAMPINGMECEAELTTTEATLCSALQIPPKEFLELREAMLRKADEERKESAGESSSSTNCHVQAFRASRTTDSENNLRVEVACQSVPRSAAAAKKDAGERREVVGGRDREKRTTIETSPNAKISERELSVEVATSDPVKLDVTATGMETDINKSAPTQTAVVTDETKKEDNAPAAAQSAQAIVVVLEKDNSADPPQDLVKDGTPSVVEVEVVKVSENDEKDEKKNRVHDNANSVNKPNEVQKMASSIPKVSEVVEISSSVADSPIDVQEIDSSAAPEYTNKPEVIKSNAEERSGVRRSVRTRVNVASPMSGAFIEEEILDGGDGGSLADANLMDIPDDTDIPDEDDDSALNIPRKRGRKVVAEEYPPSRKRRKRVQGHGSEADGEAQENQTSLASEPASPNSNESDEYVPSSQEESAQREVRRSTRRSSAAVTQVIPTRKSLRISKRNVSRAPPKVPESKPVKRTRRSGRAQPAPPTHDKLVESDTGMVSKPRTRSQPKKRAHEGAPNDKKTKKSRYSLRRNR